MLGRRGHTADSAAGPAVLAALLLLPVSALARADSTNLLPNGSFQSGTSGWKATNATFTIASDGADDSSAGRLAHSTTSSAYQLAASPKPVLNTSAGLIYVANGVVRSDTPGKSVCLQLKELTSGGSVVVAGKPACAITTQTWAALPQDALTATNSGDQIAFLVRRPSGATSGESFEVDNLSLAPSGDNTAPSVPANVSATAVSSNEIDVSWSASSDPDFGGVAGYAIYRDGGSSAIGTAGGSATSFADSLVDPGSTHSYTVAAFDAAGNYSLQSASSNAATTPQAAVVGLWHLDESVGSTAFDSSGLGNDGAISGNVTLGVAGEVNTAYRFAEGAVLVPDGVTLRPGSASISISYWLNFTTPPPIGSDYDVFVKGSSSSSGGQIKVEVQRNGQASCMFRGPQGKRQLQAGANLMDGQWHHVICKRAGNQIIQIVDGTTFSATQATGSITNTDPVRLGSHEGGGDWFNGALDEVTYSIG